jgi:CRP-like cAMP-binding protein
MELLLDIYKNVILRSRFLKDTLSNECLNKLALIVKDKTYQPEELIFSKNDVCSKLVFVNYGEVELYYHRADKNNDSRKGVIKKISN